MGRVNIGSSDGQVQAQVQAQAQAQAYVQQAPSGLSLIDVFERNALASSVLSSSAYWMATGMALDANIAWRVNEL